MSRTLELDLTLPLAGFDLTVRWETGSTFLGLFGPSGSGKTSLLEAIAGLRPAARGRIVVGGVAWLDSSAGIALAPRRRGVGYVPQDPLLFPHLDVSGNVMAGRRRARRSGRPAPDPDRVVRVLELAELQDRDVATLSGGERQRVALARALCSAPQLLLLDEPLASLDLPLRRRILPYLLRVHEEFALPTIHVSHDTAEMQALTQEILVLESGRVAGSGDPGRLLTDPETLASFHVVEVDNVLRGRVVSMEGAAAELLVAPGCRVVIPASGLRPGREALVSLRAEDLLISVGPASGLSAQNDLPAIIASIRHRAGQAEEGPVTVSADLDPGGVRLVCSITSRAASRLGLRERMPVRLIFKAQACRLLALI